jgi:hypothetical protein
LTKLGQLVEMFNLSKKPELNILVHRQPQSNGSRRIEDLVAARAAKANPKAKAKLRGLPQSNG